MDSGFRRRDAQAGTAGAGRSTWVGRCGLVVGVKRRNRKRRGEPQVARRAGAWARLAAEPRARPRGRRHDRWIGAAVAWTGPSRDVPRDRVPSPPAAHGARSAAAHAGRRDRAAARAGRVRPARQRRRERLRRHRPPRRDPVRHARRGAGPARPRAGLVQGAHRRGAERAAALAFDLFGT